MNAASAFDHISQSGGTHAPTAFVWLARADLKPNRFPDAEAGAQKAIALAPNLATAHSALGEFYYRQGQFSNAEKEFLTPLKSRIADARSYLGGSTPQLGDVKPQTRQAAHRHGACR